MYAERVGVTDYANVIPCRPLGAAPPNTITLIPVTLEGIRVADPVLPLGTLIPK